METIFEDHSRTPFLAMDDFVQQLVPPSVWLFRVLFQCMADDVGTYCHNGFVRVAGGVVC